MTEFRSGTKGRLKKNFYYPGEHDKAITFAQDRLIDIAIWFKKAV